MTDQEQRRYDAALAFATEKHDGQFRIGGLPYISHPVAVSEIIRDKGGDVDAQITALFHDLLEDTDATEKEILTLGNERILRAVKLLTKKKGYVMSDYIAGIRKNEIAFAVKGADRLHNLRCAICADEDFRRRYILESVDWYLDFAPEIPEAVKALAASLSKPLPELPFLDTPVDTWKKIKYSNEEDLFMTIETKNENGILTVSLAGRLDTTTAPALESALEGCLGDTKDLIFDLKSLEYLSSAGLRVILKVQKVMNTQGSMKLINVSESIMEVFDITGFVDILTIE